MTTTKRFSAKAHTKTDYNYSIFHQSLLHENNGEDYALRHIYSLENTKQILKKLGWTDEQTKMGIDIITIDVYEKVVYLHIPGFIIKRGEKVKIRGISRFVSKADYVNALINRCWAKADPYKLEPGSNWHELIAKGNTGDFYELNLMPHAINCTCHAFSGTEKAFMQDLKAQQYLIDHPVVEGQIPDKHVFAAWKYLRAENYKQYQYCWTERRDKNLETDWQFEPDPEYEYIW
ncbi:hypothetical protein VB713_20455 [Anabaena cylindrica UHCC 0172]|uniref:hypothetical protein n=1 Tax=Anabaena cylindrica TaxID=1165 RepID=UPI002B1F5BBB|nr:hypothetical protein [Anabaena cylindrica]MEA5553314.1 hypothetical protein [Anabaena cylindrica UHCC 0172]